MSQQPEMTPWFGGNVKPVHVGVYQKKLKGTDGPVFAYWDGSRWSAFVGPRDTPDDAMKLRNSLSAYQDVPWRGLMQKASQP